jgi:hypothetical protein
MYATEETEQWFRDRGRESEQHFTILDNGVIETGEPQSEALLAASEAIQPDCVVVPDAFKDAERTMELFRKFAPELMELAPAIMIVPQGQDLVEWVACAYALMDEATAQGYNVMLGVPKVLDTFEGGRMTAMCWVGSQVNNLNAVHLLGVWNGIEELRFLQYFPGIRGVDTSLPIAHAINDVITRPKAVKYSLSKDMWSVSDFSEGVAWQAQINIAVMRAYLSWKQQSVTDVHSGLVHVLRGLGQIQNMQRRFLSARPQDGRNLFKGGLS